jgi:alpha-L-fucosidase
VDEAKFGIFIHYGVYSVPAWGPKGTYSEWYWHEIIEKDEHSRAFHREKYGTDFKYQDFAAQFTAEVFDATRWADLFKRAGARYVVLTSKHHDGFTLWPSAQSWNWNSVDIGPHRDIVGELTEAVKAAGLHMGLYYSLYEWYEPNCRNDLPRYVDEKMLPQLKDIVERYEPSLVWTDGEWDHPSDLWRSTEYLAWLFNESPVRDHVAVNDRWGKECRSAHGGYFTTEYGEVGFGGSLSDARKWEECRGIGASFAFNREEDLGDYLSAKELIHILVDTVSKGGNLLLNIGPNADGWIPIIMQERLLQIGAWLDVNGEAIYGTKPWPATHELDPDLRYTHAGDTLYAITLKWPGATIDLSDVGGDVSAVSLLGHEGSLHFDQHDWGTRVAVPPLGPDQAPCEHAYVFKVTGAG